MTLYAIRYILLPKPYHYKRGINLTAAPADRILAPGSASVNLRIHKFITSPRSAVGRKALGYSCKGQHRVPSGCGYPVAWGKYSFMN
jgi:hypothetical protein